ncbi:hypothetical protein WA026_005323 [Henosepilachna vigintioctopunctata]|uniref:RRM domain-containing protein n=1 Tax=Henosepilachna vigintioctopunctata TaxID=420089 RepID=A0AAW1UMS0_9CUCU
MNPLTNMKNVTKLSEKELYSSNKTSWHDQYADSAWIFIGGLPYDLTEGDVICIFSQYGEIVNINLIRDKDNGKSKGYCFLCYEDQRSTVLAVDNFNGTKILNRILRVDHVSDYKIPKQGKKTDLETKKLYEEGCAPKPEPLKIINPLQEPQDVRETLADQIHASIKLPARLPIYPIKTEPLDEHSVKDEYEMTGIDKKREKNIRSNSPSNRDSSSASESYESKKRKKKKKSRRKSSSESDNEYNRRKKHKKHKYSKYKSEANSESNKQSTKSDNEKINKHKYDFVKEKVKYRRSRSRSLDRTYSRKKL